MPRKYEDIHVCPNGEHGQVHWDCSCDPGEGERVTAYDARDVEPLTRAIRPVARVGASVAASGDGACLVATSLLRDLHAALKAFEDEEGSGA